MPHKPTKAQRQLKIYEKHFQRRFERYAVFPEINLAGKWLQDLGFKSGGFVLVECKKGKIVIKARDFNNSKTD